MKLFNALIGIVWGFGMFSSASALVPPYATIPLVVNGNPNPV